LFSLLPGPFKRGFATWAKSYVHISCWTITINIFWVLTKAFSLTSLLLEEGVGHIFLSIVLFIAIFLTPTWTSKFIGGAITANIAAALSMASSRLGIGSKMAGKATKR